jgi:UDP-N-acetylmuramate: L-alanyl-gamma-D-glutamyl-meso-diaminopimelate ligase
VKLDPNSASEATELELTTASASGALRERFLAGKRLLVTSGNDGAVIAAMSAWIFASAGLEPGFFLRAPLAGFGVRARAASTKRKIIGTSAKAAPFVVDGDAFSRHDHSLVECLGRSSEEVLVLSGAQLGDAAMLELTTMIPEAGLIACGAHDPRASAIVTAHARSRVAFYALDSDATGDATPTWLGAIVPADRDTGAQPFDLYAGGSFCGRFALKVAGADSVRCAVGAIAACAEGFGVDIEKARQALTSYEGSPGR